MVTAPAIAGDGDLAVELRQAGAQPAVEPDGRRPAAGPPGTATSGTGQPRPAARRGLGGDPRLRPTGLHRLVGLRPTSGSYTAAPVCRAGRGLGSGLPALVWREPLRAELGADGGVGLGEAGVDLAHAGHHGLGLLGLAQALEGGGQVHLVEHLEDRRSLAPVEQQPIGLAQVGDRLLELAAGERPDALHVEQEALRHLDFRCRPSRPAWRPAPRAPAPWPGGRWRQPAGGAGTTRGRRPSCTACGLRARGRRSRAAGSRSTAPQGSSSPRPCARRSCARERATISG